MPSATLQPIVEYRGVEGLVAAEILVDDGTTFSTGTPFAIAGVATVEKSTENSMDTKYYDNFGAIIIDAQGNDTITLTVSAIPLDVYATLTGQYYDAGTGAVYEGNQDVKYFALGYKAQNTNNGDMYVWRLKGRFSIPNQTNQTKDASTTSNGQTLTYTGISTTHKFNKDGKPHKSVVLDASKNLVDTTNFFASVQTPDTLVPLTSYKLTKTVAAGTSVVVQKGTTYLDNNDTIYAGDQLKITVTGGTVTVDGEAFISGDIHVVTGNTAVVSTASA